VVLLGVWSNNGESRRAQPLQSDVSALLRVEGLTKRFDRRVAVDNLSFHLTCGEVLGLLGPNGAGKTTTFLCLNGLLRPDAGRIIFEGRRLESDRGRTIALIPETPDIYEMLTIWEHMLFVARSLRLERGWEARAEHLLTRLGIARERDALGQSLSKGMRQKTLIAGTLLARAPVLLLDEPMIGLDPRGQRELRDLIAELRAGGTAIVMSTHLIDSAQALCDRLIILKNGRVIAEGAISELQSRAATGQTLEDLFLEITA
jgi:ABC-2 type transport system ATP-binding protein